MKQILLAIALFLLPFGIAFAQHNNPEMQAEHTALFDLVPVENATHVASSGMWNDPATWGGEVPTDGAFVHIPAGITVSLAGATETLQFIRVDGNLMVQSGSGIEVDTLITAPDSVLTVGTEAEPVSDVMIEVARYGSYSDPTRIGLGIVAHGTVRMSGLPKTVHLKAAVDPMAGDTSITLAEAPEGWQIGDTVVIAGTRYSGYKYDPAIQAKRHYEPEDEVRIISAIDGNVVSFAEPLVHDHDAPRADLKTSVANYTRSIVIRSANPGVIEDRGHVMFMHNADVDVRYVEFHEMGRTDKSIPISAVGGPDENRPGRYPFHFHRTGAVGDLGVAVGNAVWGSPGWGYTHHDSHALMHNNASYNTFGAGFVSETGNETGTWTGNIAIYAKGVSWGLPKNPGNTDLEGTNFDIAKTGDGFWFQSRMVKASGNIAASVNYGFVYFHRGDDRSGNAQLRFDASVFDFPEALGLSDDVRPDHAPILIFTNNEAFAAKEGLHVVKHNPRQGHMLHTHITDFTAWSVQTGAQVEYTAHYIMDGLDFVAKDPERFLNPQYCIDVGSNSSDMTLVNVTCDGFKTGLRFTRHFTNQSAFQGNFDVEMTAIDVVSVNLNQPENALIGADQILTADDLTGMFNLDFDPVIYTGSDIEITGMQTDGVGAMAIPSGPDHNIARTEEVSQILAEGHYSEGGKTYFLLRDFYSNRATGDIYQVDMVVETTVTTGPDLGPLPDGFEPGGFVMSQVPYPQLDMVSEPVVDPDPEPEPEPEPGPTIEELQAIIAELEATVAAQERTIAGLDASIVALQDGAAQAQAEIDALTVQNGTLTILFAQALSDKNAAEAERDAALAAITALLAAYDAAVPAVSTARQLIGE